MSGFDTLSGSWVRDIFEAVGQTTSFQLKHLSGSGHVGSIPGKVPKGASLEKGSTNVFCKGPASKYFSPVVLTRDSFVLQETWQCLETLLVVTSEGCHWHFVSRGQGCH